MHPLALPSRTVRAAVVTCVLALLVTLGSCSGGSDGSRGGSSAVPAPSPVRTGDDRAAVQQTLAAYNAVVKASMSRHRGPIPIERLRAVVAEPYAGRFSREMADEHAARMVMRGHDVYTTRALRITGSHATLVTCWDPTRAHIVDMRTRPPQRVRPGPKRVTTFELRKQDGAWKITQRLAGRAC